MAGLPRIIDPSGASNLPVTKAPAPTMQLLPIFRAVEDNGPHANEGVVSHGAAVNNGPMADGTAPAHHRLLVEDGAVLDVEYPHPR